MEKGSRRIFRGKSGKLYSENECKAGNVPVEECPQETNILYDSTSKAMYYQVQCGRVSFKTPFLKDGKYCHFENGSIVEARA